MMHECSLDELRVIEEGEDREATRGMMLQWGKAAEATVGPVCVCATREWID